MMGSSHIDEGLDATMQRVLDGEADERTRAELEARLAEDEQLRAYFERLRETFDALGSLQTSHPPEEIREQLLEEIRGPQVGSTRPLGRRGTPRSRWRPWRPGARELLAFGAGAAAAALIAMAIPLSSWMGEPSENGSSATLLSRQTGPEVLDRSAWSASWGEGEVMLTEEAGVPAISVVHRGSVDATVTVEFDGALWEPVGIAGMIEGARLGTTGRVVLRVGPRSRASVEFRALGNRATAPAFAIRVRTENGSAETRLVGPTPDTNFRGQTE